MKTKRTLLMFAMVLYVLSVLLLETFADPSGATITNLSTISGSSSPASRADDGGSITTLQVNISQQNSRWKAYVGNVTGTLSLDDSNGYTIFDWSLTESTLSGEIYAARFGDIVWGSIACANNSNLDSEHTAIGMTSTDGDNINKTFNFTKHPSFVIAGTTITNSTCKAVNTYYNGTAQQNNESSKFSEIIIQNSEDRIIYVSNIEQDETSFVNSSFTYDFQMLLAEQEGAAITTYYFYVELDA